MGSEETRLRAEALAKEIRRALYQKFGGESFTERDALDYLEANNDSLEIDCGAAAFRAALARGEEREWVSVSRSERSDPNLYKFIAAPDPEQPHEAVPTDEQFRLELIQLTEIYYEVDGMNFPFNDIPDVEHIGDRSVHVFLLRRAAQDPGGAFSRASNGAGVLRLGYIDGKLSVLWLSNPFDLCSDEELEAAGLERMVGPPNTPAPETKKADVPPKPDDQELAHLRTEVERLRAALQAEEERNRELSEQLQGVHGELEVFHRMSRVEFDYDTLLELSRDELLIFLLMNRWLEIDPEGQSREEIIEAVCERCS